MDILKLYDFKDYFEHLSQNKGSYIILICSRDNIGESISEKQADLIRSLLGIRTDISTNRGLKGDPYRAYFAIIDGGKILAEELGSDERTLRYKDQKFYVKSTVYTHTRGVEHARILVNKAEYCANKKGLNIVVVEKETGHPIDSVNLYILSEACELYRTSAFSDKELSVKYQKFRDKFKNIKTPPLGLYKPKYPYRECAIVHSSKEVEVGGLSAFAEKEKMHFTILNKTAVISFGKLKKDKNGLCYFFSGITKWKDKLIYGFKDIKSNDISVTDLKEGIGEFDLLTFDGESIECSTDYFGICKWYYYKGDDGYFVAATSYHLLILTLKSLNIKMKLNIKKVSAAMGFFSAIAETNFTEEMDMENCYELPPTFKIIISSGEEVLLEENSLHQAITNPPTYSEENYEEHLLLVKEDLISNMRVLLEHPNFERIVIELSGGLDSRIVLAAAMNLPEHLTRKIRITSYSSETEGYRIANGIIDYYGLRWNDSPIERKVPKSRSKNKLSQSPISHNLGNYWLTGTRERNPYLVKHENVEATIYTTGIMGEVLYRPFYTWCNYDRGIDYLASSLVSAVDIGKETNAGKYLKHYITETLNSFPPKGLIEKMETHYLFYRNRHHCSKKYSPTPYWIPLQSKIAFDCRTMRYRAGKFDRKFAFDLLALLDPFLVNFPYESEENNEFLLEWRLQRSEEFLLDIKPSFEIEKTPRLSRKIYYDSSKEDFIAFGKELMKKYESKYTLLTALNTFLNYSEEFEEFGKVIYQLLVGITPRAEQKARYASLFVAGIRKRRLFSIYQQIKLIES